MCAEDPQCTHWTWDHQSHPSTSTRQTCWLKHSAAPWDDDYVNPVPDCGCVSGETNCFH